MYETRKTQMLIHADHSHILTYTGTLEQQSNEHQTQREGSAVMFLEHLIVF